MMPKTPCKQPVVATYHLLCRTSHPPDRSSGLSSSAVIRFCKSPFQLQGQIPVKTRDGLCKTSAHYYRYLLIMWKREERGTLTTSLSSSELDPDSSEPLSSARSPYRSFTTQKQNKRRLKPVNNKTSLQRAEPASLPRWVVGLVVWLQLAKR